METIKRERGNGFLGQGSSSQAGTKARATTIYLKLLLQLIWHWFAEFPLYKVQILLFVCQNWFSVLVRERKGWPFNLSRWPLVQGFFSGWTRDVAEVRQQKHSLGPAASLGSWLTSHQCLQLWTPRLSCFYSLFPSHQHKEVFSRLVSVISQEPSKCFDDFWRDYS